MTRDARRVAERHRWLWRANRERLARQPRGQREELLERLAKVRYREREVPDKGSTLEELLATGEGDCEDLCAAWHALLETLLPDHWSIVAVLVPGGRAGWWHLALRLGNGRREWWFDPSVDAGMRPPPPLAAYGSNSAVVVERRVVKAF